MTDEAILLSPCSEMVYRPNKLLQIGVLKSIQLLNVFQDTKVQNEIQFFAKYYVTKYDFWWIYSYSFLNQYYYYYYSESDFNSSVCLFLE